MSNYIHRPLVLMLRADRYEPAAADHNGYANAWEEAGRRKFLDNPDEFRRVAQTQSRATAVALSRHSGLLYDRAPMGLPDAVFVTDVSITLRTPSRDNGTRVVTILGNYTNEKRAAEVYAHQRLLRAIDDGREIIQCPYPLEGGDCVYDPYRKLIWAGYTDNASPSNAQHGRTSLQAHEFVREKTGVEIISLQTRRPYYHGDTVLGPLTFGHIIAHHRDLHPSSHATFMKNAFDRYSLDPEKYLITVSDADAAAFAANLHAFGPNVVMPDCSPELKERIESEGYKVSTVKVNSFMLGGGAVHCISNVISGYDCNLA